MTKAGDKHKNQSRPSSTENWLKKSPIILFCNSMNIYFICCALCSQQLNTITQWWSLRFPLNFFVEKDWKLIFLAIIVDRIGVCGNNVCTHWDTSKHRLNHCKPFFRRGWKYYQISPHHSWIIVTTHNTFRTWKIAIDWLNDSLPITLDVTGCWFWIFNG